MLKYLMIGLMLLLPTQSLGFGLVGFSSPNLNTTIYENLLKDSEDCDTANWTRGATLSFTTQPDNSQIGITSDDSVLYLLQADSKNCLADGGSYVFRGQIKNLTEGESLEIKINGMDGADAREYGGAWGQPYTKVTIPFVATVGVNTYPIWSSTTGIGSPGIQMRDLQLAINPGAALYSTGDSICEYSQFFNEELRQDTSFNYTKWFMYDKNIAGIADGHGGAKLTDILGYLQAALDPETFPVVMIEGGINDLISNSVDPTAAMKVTYASMVTLAKANSDLVVLIAIPPFFDVAKHGWWTNFNDWIDTTYGSDSQIFIYHPADDIGDVDGYPDTAYYSASTLHPDLNGHKMMGERLVSLVPMPSSVLYINEYVQTAGTCVEP